MIGQNASEAAPPIMSKKDFAAYKGWSPSAVSKAISRGKLTQPALLPDGRIDRVLADRQLADRSDPARYLSGKQPSLPIDAAARTEGEDDEETAGPAEPAFAAVRSDTERLKQRKLQRELDILDKKYVLREEVDVDAFSAARQLRDALFGLVDMLADQAASMVDPREIKALFRQETRKTLTEVGRNIRHGSNGLSE